MKLWIDDIRTIPEGYIGEKSAKMMCNKKVFLEFMIDIL